MTVINVTYTLKPGMRDGYIHELLENRISERTTAEPGCLQYSFSTPIDPAETDTLFLRERYENDEALIFHKQQEHFALLQEIKAKYVDSTDVRIYRD